MGTGARAAGAIASCGDDGAALRRCIVAGFFANAAQANPDGSYRTLKDGRCVRLHPNSVLARFGETPEWVVCVRPRASFCLCLCLCVSVSVHLFVSVCVCLYVLCGLARLTPAPHARAGAVTTTSVCACASVVLCLCVAVYVCMWRLCRLCLCLCVCIAGAVDPCALGAASTTSCSPARSTSVR